MVEKEEKVETIEIPLELSPDMKQVYMTGAIGGHTPHDFRLIIFNEATKENKSDEELGLARIISHEIIMSHRAVKELYNWLGKHIENHDKQMEKIKEEK